MPPKNSVWNKVKQTAAQTQQTQIPPPPPPQPVEQPPPPWYTKYMPNTQGETPGWLDYMIEKFGSAPKEPNTVEMVRAAREYIDKNPVKVGLGGDLTADAYNAREALDVVDKAIQSYVSGWGTSPTYYVPPERAAYDSHSQATIDLLSRFYDPKEFQQSLKETSYFDAINKGVLKLMDYLYRYNQQAAQPGSNTMSTQAPPLPNPYNYPTR